MDNPNIFFKTFVILSLFFFFNMTTVVRRFPFLINYYVETIWISCVCAYSNNEYPFVNIILILFSSSYTHMDDNYILELPAKSILYIH